MLTMVVSHSVMFPLMVMTPVHMAHSGTGLSVIGAVASGHVLGMYALSPIFGRLCDRWGRRAGLLTGLTLLLLAMVTTGAAGHDNLRLAAGLLLLGLGWSACLVAGSLLLGESVPAAHRVRAQGVADMMAGLTAATCGLAAGPLLGAFGYPALTLVAALVVGLLLTVHLCDGLGVRGSRNRGHGGARPHAGPRWSEDQA
jgi:MFS family permease